jgi:hypothetical protein
MGLAVMRLTIHQLSIDSRSMTAQPVFEEREQASRSFDSSPLSLSHAGALRCASKNTEPAAAIPCGQPELASAREQIRRH